MAVGTCTENSRVVQSATIFGGALGAARAALLLEALSHPGVPPGDPWRSFAIFLPDGRCAANVDAACLPLVCEGESRSAGAIRAVAVTEPCRGRGLFRQVMTAALDWLEAVLDGPIFLYTEEPDLYRRFGFQRFPQYSFSGPAPGPLPSTAVAQPCLLSIAPQRALLAACLARRSPVSQHCTLMTDATQILTTLELHPEFAVDALPAHEAFIVSEREDDGGFTLVDIIAPRIPDLASILGSLGLAPRRVTTLFAPDRIEWSGRPRAEETGLMVRGSLPSACARPFMFPPLSEF